MLTECLEQPVLRVTSDYRLQTVNWDRKLGHGAGPQSASPGDIVSDEHAVFRARAGDLVELLQHPLTRAAISQQVTPRQLSVSERGPDHGVAGSQSDGARVLRGGLPPHLKLGVGASTGAVQ